EALGSLEQIDEVVAGPRMGPQVGPRNARIPAAPGAGEPQRPAPFDARETGPRVLASQLDETRAEAAAGIEDARLGAERSREGQPLQGAGRRGKERRVAPGAQR